MYITDGEEEGDGQVLPPPEATSTEQNGSTSPPKEKKSVEVTEILRQHSEAEGSKRDEGGGQEEWGEE